MALPDLNSLLSETDGLVLKPESFDLPFGEKDYKAKRNRLEKYDDLVETFAKIHGEDIPDLANWARAVMMRESGGVADPEKAVSPSEAKGLMQMLEGTFQDMGGNPADIFDPVENIDKGVKYLAEQMRKFGDPMVALAAYNAGPGNVRKHSGIPNFQETKDYVKAASAYFTALRGNPPVLATLTPAAPPVDPNAPLPDLAALLKETAALVGQPAAPSAPAPITATNQIPGLGGTPPSAKVPGPDDMPDATRQIFDERMAKADAQRAQRADAGSMVQALQAQSPVGAFLTPEKIARQMGGGETPLKVEAGKPDLEAIKRGSMVAPLPEKTGTGTSTANAIGDALAGVKQFTTGLAGNALRGEGLQEALGRRFLEAMENAKTTQAAKKFEALSDAEKDRIRENAKAKGEKQENLSDLEQAALTTDESWWQQAGQLLKAAAKNPGLVAQELVAGTVEDLPFFLLTSKGIGSVLSSMKKAGQVYKLEKRTEKAMARTKDAISEASPESYAKAANIAGRARRMEESGKALLASKEALSKPSNLQVVADEVAENLAAAVAVTEPQAAARGEKAFTPGSVARETAMGFLGAPGALLRNVKDARLTAKELKDVGKVAYIQGLEKHPAVKEMTPIFQALTKSPELEGLKVKAVPERFGITDAQAEAAYGRGHKGGEVTGAQGRDKPGRQAVKAYKAPQKGEITIYGKGDASTLLHETVHFLQERVAAKAKAESVSGSPDGPYTQLMQDVKAWEDAIFKEAKAKGLNLPQGDELLAHVFPAYMGYAHKARPDVRRVVMPDRILEGYRKLMTEDPAILGKEGLDQYKTLYGSKSAYEAAGRDIVAKSDLPVKEVPKPETPKPKTEYTPEELKKLFDDAMAETEAMVKKDRMAREKAINLTPRPAPKGSAKPVDEYAGLESMVGGQEKDVEYPDIKIPEGTPLNPTPPPPKTKRQIAAEAKAAKAAERLQATEAKKAEIAAQAPLRKRFEEELRTRKHRPAQFAPVRGTKVEEAGFRERQMVEGFSGLDTRKVPAKNLPKYFTLDGEVYRRLPNDEGVVVVKTASQNKLNFAPDQEIHVDRKIGEASRGPDYGEKEFGPIEKETSDVAPVYDDDSDPLPFSITAMDEGQVPPGFVKSGNPSRVDRKVDDLRATETKVGKAPAKLDRQTPESWAGNDPDIQRILKTYTDEDWEKIHKKRIFDAKEQQAHDAVLRGKGEHREALEKDLAALRASGADPKEVSAKAREYLTAELDFIAHSMINVNNGTAAGRALAARRRIMKASAVDPEAELIRKIMREFPGVGQKDLADIMQAWKTNPAQFADLLRALTKAPVADKLLEAWRAGLLSAFVTDIRNVAGNFFFNAMNTLENVPAGAIDAVFSKMAGTARTRYLEDAAAEVAGAMIAAPTAGKNLVRNLRDVVTLKDKPIDLDQKFKGELGAIGTGKPTFYRPAEKAVGKVVRTAFRKLEAEDVFFKDLIGGSELFKRALQKARSEGKGYKRAHEIFKAYDPSKDVDLTEQIVETQRERTFQKNPSSLGQAILHARRKFKILNLVVPFAQTPSNILDATIERTPFGLRGVVKAINAFKEAKKAGASADELAKLQGVAVDKLARVTSGMALMSTAYFMANSGLMTGGGPEKKEEFDALFASGWRPYSFVKEDENGEKVYIPFSHFEPISSLLGMASDIAEVKSAKTKEDKFWKGVGSITENLINKSYLEGLNNAFAFMDSPRRMAPAFLSSLAGSVVPNIAARTAAAMDPVVRETREPGAAFYERPINTIKSRIPGVSKSLPPKVDVFGEEATRQGGAMTRFTAPIAVSEDKETADLAKVLISSGFTPDPPTKVLEIDEEQFPLNDKERELLIAARRAAVKQAAVLARSASFKRLDPDIREKRLRKIFEARLEPVRNRVKGMVRSRTVAERAESRRARKAEARKELE